MRRDSLFVFGAKRAWERSFAGYTAWVRLAAETYHYGTTIVHRADPRVKIALLLAYSIMLFLLETWAGLAIAAVAYGLAHVASRVSFRSVFTLAAPTYMLVAVAIIFCSFSWNISLAAAPVGSEASMAGPFALCEPVALAGSFGFLPAGFMKGAYNALRVVILVYASLLVSFTTSSAEMMRAALSFLSPLRRTSFPVDDAANAITIALRFIPVTAEELCLVHDAQWSRGARFSGAGVAESLRAWSRVFVSLFVALFRRADRLASAMDARCYGAPTPQGRRSALGNLHLGARGTAAIVLGIVACVLLAVFF